MPGIVKEIAKRSGASVPAVYQALSGTGRLRPETRERIKTIAAELGHKPNAAARAIASGRFRSVALLMRASRGGTYLAGDMLFGIQNKVVEHDLHLIQARLPASLLTDEEFVPKILRELSCDGLLINYSGCMAERMVKLIRAFSVPSVWLNSKQRWDCVRPDDYHGAEQATAKLISLGHKKIVLFHPASPLVGPHYSSTDRLRGYRHAMQKAGLRPHVVQPAERLPYGDRTEFARAQLKRLNRATGLVTLNDFEALTTVQAAFSLGIRVPDDLSLVTLANDLKYVQLAHLSAFLVPHVGVGEQGVELLMRKIDAPSKRHKPRALPFEFIAGESCKPNTR
ncbi:MAG: LacI family DNA-binding transcriptional regulator [Kiritimatiellae bacterium]|nr:LacI family DNA-binding transcriptional regulator [Kiritimatiellia bacterium]